MSKLTVADLPLSNFLLDKKFRLLNSVNSRINALEWQYAYYIKYRSNTHPIDRNNYCNHIRLLKRIHRRLVNNPFICNSSFWYSGYYRAFKSFPLKVEDHSTQLLGFYIPKKLNLRKKIDDLEYNLKNCPVRQRQFYTNLIEKEEFNIEVTQNIIDKMQDLTLKSRKSELVARLHSESHLRVSQGWFVLFNTLTPRVDNKEAIFNDKNSTAWTDYVRSVDRAIGIRVYGSWRNAVRARAKGQEFHRYFAVIERGNVSGNPHFHVLHFMKDVPEGCNSDPNFGRKNPNYREIHGFRRFWQHGFSSPRPVRFDMSDAWKTKYQFVWPTGCQTCSYKKCSCKKPIFSSIPCRDSKSVVNYVTKYLTKEYEKCQNNNEKVIWRTKLSRKLGSDLPQKIVDKLTNLQLELIVRVRSRKTFQIKNKNLPLWMMKKMAMRRLLKKKLTLTPRSYWKLLLNLKPREGFLKRVQSMMNQSEMSKPPSFGDLRTITLSDQVGSKILNIIKKIEYKYFGNDNINLCLNGSSTEVRCG